MRKIPRLRQTGVGRCVLMLLPAATAAFGLASCGSAKDSSSSTQAGLVAASNTAPKCGDATGKPATGQPIPVGGMTTETNGPNISEGPKAAQAFFACLNANGGIHGRPIAYTYEDDGLNPATAARAANDLVSDKKVVGVAGSTAYLECAVAGPIYEQAKVMEVEAAGGPAQCFTLPNIVSVSEGGILSTSLAVQDEISQGAKRIALLGPNTPGLGQAFIAAAKRTAAANGGQLVAGVLYAPGIQDATSVLLQAAAAKPTAIVLVGVEQDLVSILKTAQTQNMKGRFKFAAAAPLYSPEAPKALGPYWWGGAIRVAHQFAPFDANTPDNRLWHEVMNKYAPGVPQDEFAQGAFLSAKVFADTIARINGPITRASVTKALQAARDYKSDLLCRPWSWVTGNYHVSNTVGRIATINSAGAWQDVGGCTTIKDPILSAQ
jgi:branched-chain amino acid transport system substrate-binding protein